MRIISVLLVIMLAAGQGRADSSKDPVRAAVVKALARIERGTISYIHNRQCFSCHHQAVALWNLRRARELGFTVNAANFRKQVEFIRDSFHPKLEQIAQGKSMPGGNTMTAYALFTFEGAGQAADETTIALVRYLLERQKPDGSWPALANRPPSEGSTFTNNALALRGLRYYRPPSNDAKSKELGPRIDQALAKGANWLRTNSPVTTEDKMFRLRGLTSAKADATDVRAAREALLKEQRPDGSWAQLPELAGDAYATGGVLTALREAGLSTGDPAYQRGLRCLLAGQTNDGSWLVQTRSKPVQAFFDNGDPGGKSQFISFLATNWATLALLESLPRQDNSLRRSRVP